MSPPSLQAATPRLLLASQSTARAAMLTAAGLRFEARPASVDEDAVKASMRAEGDQPADCALTLAEMKASRLRDPDGLVIGADQILVCDGEWFDKPADRAEARRHLQRLRGRAHTPSPPSFAAAMARRSGTTWRPRAW